MGGAQPPHRRFSGDAATSTITTSCIWSSIYPGTPANFTQVIELATLTHLDAANTYHQLNFSFTAPVGTSAARLSFKFQSDYLGWLLDDVSVKANHAPDDELIQDGGFEDRNTTVWNYCFPITSATTPTFSSSTCHSGLFCFQTQSFNHNDEYLGQGFHIENETVYSVEFFALSRDSDDRLIVKITFQ